MLTFYCTIFMANTLLAQDAKTASQNLAEVIKTVEDFEPYEGKAHPLGRYEADLESKKAEFAKNQLKRLDSISVDTLSETEGISLELLRFVLQNRIDKFRYEMHLNPIQADQGFHLNLNYRIKPILNYKNAKEYLKLLNDMLGAKFDIRQFHEIILEQGTVTLPILERRIDAYIASLKKAGK